MSNDDAEKLKNYLTGADDGDGDRWLEEMKERYPFFSLPEAQRLRKVGNTLSPAQVADAVEALVLSVSDPEVAERLTQPDGTRFDNFYPTTEANSTPSTESAISKFLSTYGNADPSETETLEKLIFNPVPDYARQLARQEEDSLPENAPTGNSREDRINRFILSVRSHDRQFTDDNLPVPELQGKTEEPVPVKPPETAPDNSLLSESLAKIYIKTRRYRQACEILTRLSLDFPEKNAYFADQLRFLRKLMLAESFRLKRIDNQINPK